jgi:hypothetical protein
MSHHDATHQQMSHHDVADQQMSHHDATDQQMSKIKASCDRNGTTRAPVNHMGHQLDRTLRCIARLAHEQTQKETPFDQAAKKIDRIWAPTRPFQQPTK